MYDVDNSGGFVAISTPSFLPVDSATSSVVHDDPSLVETHRSVVLYMPAYIFPSLE